MPVFLPAEIIAATYNFTPLPRTWYESEFEDSTFHTLRFAKRTDHTGCLIKYNKTELFDENS